MVGVLKINRPGYTYGKGNLIRRGKQLYPPEKSGGYSEMKRILLTGMSGVGKSSLIDVLQEKGYTAIDTDEPGWIIHRDDGERIWDREKMSSLLATHNNEQGLIVSGTVINQKEFYNYFDKVILLTAPLNVIRERLEHRTNNSYGKSPEEMSEVKENKKLIEPILRQGADLEINTEKPFIKVVEEILNILEN